MSKAYIPRMTMSKCDKGSAPSPLMINPDHGVIFHSAATPLLNANDHMPGVNILPYGSCAVTHGPCAPQTAPLAWKNVNDKHIIDGAPALLEDSTLTCVLGGTISIIMSSSSVEANAPKTADEPDHVEAGHAVAAEPENEGATSSGAFWKINDA